MFLQLLLMGVACSVVCCAPSVNIVTHDLEDMTTREVILAALQAYRIMQPSAYVAYLKYLIIHSSEEKPYEMKMTRERRGARRLRLNGGLVPELDLRHMGPKYAHLSGYRSDSQPKLQSQRKYSFGDRVHRWGRR